MAILKQNGVEGKILRAQQSGKVLKQNYSFGNSFVGINGESIEVKGLNSYPELSFISYMRVASWSIQNFFCKLYDDSNTDLYFMYRYSNRSNYSLGTAGSGNTVGLITNSASDFYINYFNYVNFTDKKIASGTSFLPINYVDNIKLETFFLNGIDKVIIKAAQTQLAINDFIVFNRKLTDVELQYRENNHLGNELLNTSGIAVWFDFKEAKNLIIDGVNVVGVEDKSGNGNHGKILGLPAGTLTEQLNYANANLFKLW